MIVRTVCLLPVAAGPACLHSVLKPVKVAVAVAFQVILVMMSV